MRLRTRDSSQPLSYTVIANGHGCNPTMHTETTTVLPYWTGEKRKMWDLVTPNFNKRIKAGEIIVNPMTAVLEESYVSLDGPHSSYNCAPPNQAVQNYTLRQGAHFVSIVGFPLPKELFTGPEVEDLMTVAATKAWASVAQSDAQVLVFLAELKKTVSLLLNPLGNAHRFITKVRQAKMADPSAIKRGLTVGQYLASEWLTFRYGWLQLKRDFESISKAVGRDKKTGIVTSRGSVKGTKEATVTKSTTYSAFDVTYRVDHADTISVKAGLIHAADLDVNDFLGIKLDQLLATGWEVIPYSFVVDWVINVQSYLLGLLPRAITPVKGRYTVIDRTQQVTVTPISTAITASADPNTVLMQGVVGNLVFRKRTKTRLTIVPDPGLRLNIKISDFLDSRVLDGIALLLQRLNRR